MTQKHGDGQTWDDDEIRELKTLWGEGRSCAEIAVALNGRFKRGRTRMSVSGKANRLDLPHRSRESAAQYARQNAKGRAFRSGPEQLEPSPERKAGLGKVWIKKPRLLPGQTPADGFLITDVPRCGCRYALTADAPHRFCGRPIKPGTSYCAPHFKGLHQPGPAPGNPHARETAKDQAR